MATKTAKRFKWTIEIEVDECIVADGFDLSSNDQAKDFLAHALPFAYGHEIDAKVILSPDQKDIRRVQGYDDKP